ncbi:MAG TPA: hypothetical protein VGB84_08400, partial [Arachidicoccus sp.]
MKQNISYKTIFLLLIASFIVLSSCHKETETYVQPIRVNPGQYITSDTLTGSVKGTLQHGKTYYFASDITINHGDTLLMEPGSKLVSLGDGSSTEQSPQITCSGTFISIGSK